MSMSEGYETSLLQEGERAQEALKLTNQPGIAATVGALMSQIDLYRARKEPTMSNYPSGVSGNEWQIAGPRAEYTEQRVVHHDCNKDPYDNDLGFDGNVDVEVTVGEITRTVTWTCPQCGAEVEDEEELETDDGDY